MCAPAVLKFLRVWNRGKTTGNTFMQHVRTHKKESLRKRNIVVFCIIAVIWLLLDFLSKQHFDYYFEPGEIIAGPFLGIFRFELVHNTGAAWGMFNDATYALGVFSLIICAVVFVYVITVASRVGTGTTIGLALVFAGGLGNALSRFYPGYVVDFIDLVFVQFPVFNIADIGVTCGIVIFVLSILFPRKRKVLSVNNEKDLPDYKIDSSVCKSETQQVNKSMKNSDELVCKREMRCL